MVYMSVWGEEGGVVWLVCVWVCEAKVGVWVCVGVYVCVWYTCQGGVWVASMSVCVEDCASCEWCT